MDDMGYDKLRQQNVYLVSVVSLHNPTQELSICTIIPHAVFEYIMCTESRRREFVFPIIVYRSVNKWNILRMRTDFWQGCVSFSTSPALFPGP